MNKQEYFHQLHQLIELQKVDDSIYKVQQRIDNAPLALNELEQKFEEIQSRRNHILDKLSHLQDQKKRLSFEIDDDSERIKKNKNRLMQVENSREYQAMLREMDSMEKVNRTREEEKITLLEELQLQNRNLEEIDKDYNDIKARYEEKKENFNQSRQQEIVELERLNKIRQEVSKSLPVPIFMRYEFIRKRLTNPVIVEAEDGVCSGCHIAMPPQTFIELQMGDQILNCPNCQRLIFWSQHYEDPDGNVKTVKQDSHQEENNDNTSWEPAGSSLREIGEESPDSTGQDAG